MSEQPIPTDSGEELDRMVYLRLFGPISSEARWLGWYHDGGNGRYSSNIAHAFEVVDAVRKKTGCLDLFWFDSAAGPYWSCSFSHNGEESKADTAPLAICLDALRALEPTP